MIWDKWSRDENGNSVSKLYSINTEGIFMTNPKHKYPNKKDVEFDVEHIGKIFQTDTPATYFEKRYGENFNAENYTDYVGNGAICYGGAGCGKTYRLCKKASEAQNPIILSFSNKAIENVKEVFKKEYAHTDLDSCCYTFDLFFCDYHGRDISSLENKTIFIDEYSMTPNKWMTKVYEPFTKYKLTTYMFGDTNQCDPVELRQVHYDYNTSIPVSEMCPKRVEMKYIERYARYDPQTKYLLTKFLNKGIVEHQFEPRQEFDINACYKNKLVGLSQKNVVRDTSKTKITVMWHSNIVLYFSSRNF